MSVSASPSSDITEGMALCLTCCSPAAGPKAHFRWYKTDGTPRHAGQVWRMGEISSEASGSYFCQVQTGDKVQNSTVLTVDVQCKWRINTFWIWIIMSCEIMHCILTVLLSVVQSHSIHEKNCSKITTACMHQVTQAKKTSVFVSEWFHQNQ